MPTYANGATDGDDQWYVAQPGAFTLDGHGGTDTLELGTALRSNYSITLETDGSVHVDSITAASGKVLKAVLVNMEILKFDSGRDVVDLRTYFGNSGKSILGTNGDDILKSTSANETIDGGAGVDTAQFQGKLSTYKVVMTGSNGIVTDTVAGRDGIDTLKNIEHLRFTDFDINTGIKALAASMNTATVQRVMELYVAFFNRTPDADGLTYWLGQSKVGTSTTQIAESFYGVGIQYTSLTGFSSTMTTTDFINVVYRNVLGRADGADAGGLQYWTDKLTSGKETRGSLVSTILDAAHTYKGDATYGWVANLLDNKITVATKLAIDWGLNYLNADASVTNGMAIAKAVTPTDITAAIALVGVPDGTVILG